VWPKDVSGLEYAIPLEKYSIPAAGLALIFLSRMVP